MVRGWILESLRNTPGQGGSQQGLTEVWTTTAEVSPRCPCFSRKSDQGCLSAMPTLRAPAGKT